MPCSEAFCDYAQYKYAIDIDVGSDSYRRNSQSCDMQRRTNKRLHRVRQKVPLRKIADFFTAQSHA